MPTARLCPIADVAALLPAGSTVARHLAPDAEEWREAQVLVVKGGLQLPHLHMDTALKEANALSALAQAAGYRRTANSPPLLLVVEGDLCVDGALTCDDSGQVPYLLVQGDARMSDAVLGGFLLHVQGNLVVHNLLWGGGRSGALDTGGDLQARVALFTDEFDVAVGGAEQVEFLMDEVRGVAHLAEFSPEIVGAVFPGEFHDGIDAGNDGLAFMLDRDRVLAAVRAGQAVARASSDIHARFPIAADLCAGDAISIENILALVRCAVVEPKARKAYGWFGQTDFSICQRHVCEDGDQRDDNVLITVWKTWDFYLSVQQVPKARTLGKRIADTVRGRPAATEPQLLLLYLPYTDGMPGEWQALDEDAPPQALKACTHAWRGVLDYVRKAVGQHRARYPLYQRLLEALAPARIEDFTSLPVFTERYNDWWDSDRNGFWEGDAWVGARQPCMYKGEPYGRAYKISWENGGTAPGDEEDDAHACYQMEVREQPRGPAQVEFTYAQRQSATRTALPRSAADHIARLLRLDAAVQKRVRAQHAQQLAREAETQRIAAAVVLLARPPLAPGLPDEAVFPPELMALSAQWQADGRAYVAIVLARTLASDAGTAGDEGEGDEGGEDQDAALRDPRTAAAPTVLQLARVVNAEADEALRQRFRNRFAFAPDAFVEHAADAGRAIGPVFALDDGRVVARIGAPWDEGAHWVQLDGFAHTRLSALHGLGRSMDRRCFAQSDGRHITTHQGFGGPVIAQFALPRGDEGLPPHLGVAGGPLGQRCDELIPFNDGLRVLLLNPTGVYLLAAGGSVQRVHPQTFDEDGPYTWPKNQMDDDADDAGAGATMLALDMLHMALSPCETRIAVGDQDSGHIVLDAQQGAVLATHEPLSSYPHHAVFTHDSARLLANACHFYGGDTLSVALDAPAAAAAPAPQDEPAPWFPGCRLYASAALPGMVVAGDASGYLHAAGDAGEPLWRHHIGSTISAIDASPDGATLWAASYGGYLVRLERSTAGGSDPHAIATSPYRETERFIVWDGGGAGTPLRW